MHQVPAVACAIVLFGEGVTLKFILNVFDALFQMNPPHTWPAIAFLNIKKEFYFIFPLCVQKILPLTSNQKIILSIYFLVHNYIFYPR